jgi:predicted DNA-binding transcriptional regulator AlpA
MADAIAAGKTATTVKIKPRGRAADGRGSEEGRRDMQNRKLRVDEAAAYLGLGKSMLDKLRVTGDGPAFARLGRRVVCDLADLDACVAGGRRQRTSARAAAA